MLQVNLQSDEVILNGGDVRTHVQAIDSSIIRVVHTAAGQPANKPSLMVLEPSRQARIGLRRVEDDGRTITLATERLKLQVDRCSGALTWLDSEGGLLLRERSPESGHGLTGGRELTPIKVERRIFDESVRIEAEHTTDGIKARVANAKVVVDRVAFSAALNLHFAQDELIFGLG
ncbi:MAG: DUF4968 domain-containing protein, partial [Phycisphaerales bacterium]|nr:DUF4968 domain-containing protein [Phycisphaerales bacterium]